MSTFTIDLISGNVFLFTGDFSGSPSTGSTSVYPSVNVFAELPDPSTHNDLIYVVKQGSGEYIVNRKKHTR
jgi:hypothetical protein